MRVMQITVDEDYKFDAEEFCIWIAVPDGFSLSKEGSCSLELSETDYDSVVPGVDFVVIPS